MRYIEQTEKAYLLSIRLNPSKGTFPMFRDRFKRHLGYKASTSPAEAEATAAAMKVEIENLQVVSSRDKAGRTQSSADIGKAVQVWVRFIDVDVAHWQRVSHLPTEEAETARAEKHLLTEAIKEHYFNEATGYLSPLGAAMSEALEGKAAGVFLKDAIDLWRKQTGRDHLPDTDKSIRDAARNVEAFINVIGDKAIDLISRKDVATFIDARLKEGKTTTVEREITSLRAIWNKAALAVEMDKRNPFAEQPIKGLGTDTEKRKTPTLEEHQKLLKDLEAAAEGKGYSTALIAIIALSGMRLSEAWGLEEADWDKEAGILYIRPNKTRPTLKTAQSERPFPVTEELAKWLGRYFKTSRASTANSASAALGKKLGQLCPDLVAHGLRHGFKQRLVEMDAPGNHINELMGWSEQHMAENYGHKTITKSRSALIHNTHNKLTNIEDSGKVIHIHGRVS